jgi:hypothetical protein
MTKDETLKGVWAVRRPRVHGDLARRHIEELGCAGRCSDALRL